MTSCVWVRGAEFSGQNGEFGSRFWLPQKKLASDKLWCCNKVDSVLPVPTNWETTVFVSDNGEMHITERGKLY